MKLLYYIHVNKTTINAITYWERVAWCRRSKFTAQYVMNINLPTNVSNL